MKRRLTQILRRIDCSASSGRTIRDSTTIRSVLPFRCLFALKGFSLTRVSMIDYDVVRDGSHERFSGFDMGIGLA